jgi:phosphoribosylformylglycinamidine synthase subunit PurSL
MVYRRNGFVTTYTIEVRAIAERYDILAQQVARELLLLPTLNRGKTGYHIRSAQLYHLTGSLSPTDIDQLTSHLFIDPVTQQATISTTSTSTFTDTGQPSDPRTTSGIDDTSTAVDVFFHAGVTDTLAESILSGASLLGIQGLERVETGQRYFLDERLSEEEVRLITEALLYNPVIQSYTLRRRDAIHRVQVATLDQGRGRDESRPYDAGRIQSSMGMIAPLQVDQRARTIALTSMSDEQLMELSRRGMLALNLDEMRTIQRYYREQGREPSDVEMETLAQTWSEHCSHKTFKATIDYREVDGEGNVIERETIAGLLKQYIMRATQQVARPWVASAFSDNAGIVRFTETQDIAFKVETHNHPSAIEPFGGANTGVGGVIRDVLGVSAQPIACTDILCFGPPETPAAALPPGVLSPHRIAGGVVNGVRDYGNKMGIPTVNGAILYHPGYIYNPLVFCGCLGMLPHGSHPRAAQPGDAIVVLGGRTGRDGIHGATFSSGEMSSETSAQAGSAVQIGAPITEKKVVDVITQARDRRLYHAITDCGAGGFSSAIGEMAAETGAFVELEKAPLKYQGLAPWEIWLSEAQERMVLAVPPQLLDDLLALCAIEEVEASVLGSFTGTHRLVVTYAGQTVADLDMAFLHDGRPGRRLEAVWVRENAVVGTRLIASSSPSSSISTLHEDAINRVPTTALLDLLRHPTIASKEAVVRRYDHEVQGATVLKPLVGRAGNGPSDAAVLQPLLEEGTRAGIVLSNGINPLYGRIDPYWMAMNAVDEALRNLAAVGGDIERATILDNFCWGNPADPAQLGLLVRAVKGCYDAAAGFGVPFISGKDSLNNEYRHDGERLPVMPTLLISAVGTIDDAAQTVDMSLKSPGNLLYLVGMTRNELAGSHYFEVTSIPTMADSMVNERDMANEQSMATARVATTIYEEASSTEYRSGDPCGRHAPSTMRLDDIPDTTVPHVDIHAARAAMQATGRAIRRGVVMACHDLSEGGLAVAAAEMSLSGLLGVSIDLEMVPREMVEMEPGQVQSVLLFSESASRFLLEIAPEQQAAFEQHMRAHGVKGVAQIGRVTESGRFVVSDRGQVLIDLPVDELQAAWKGERA